MSLSTMYKLLIGTLAIAMIAGCASSNNYKRTTSTKGAIPQDHPLSKSGNPASYVVFGKTYHLLPTSKGYKETGMASWYGDKFHGKPTSSGTPYDMHAYTAAHKTLPIPSYVIVTNTDTGKSITVLVNDRGPFVKGRIIDLSYSAAKVLDVVQKGTAPVLVEAIGPYQYLDPSKKPLKNPVTTISQAKPGSDNAPPNPTPATNPYVESTPLISAPTFNQNNVVVLEQQSFEGAPTTPEFIDSSYSAQMQNNNPINSSQSAPSYHIQLGSFGNEQNALNFQQNIAQQLQQQAQVKYDNGLYRVFVGHYHSREEAGNAAFSIPLSTTVIHF